MKRSSILVFAAALLSLGGCGDKDDTAAPDETEPPIETQAPDETDPPVETGDSEGGDDSAPPEDTAWPDDADADGYTRAEGDCDDADPTRHPGAVEYCNGIDDDCDGDVDEDPCPGGCDLWVPNTYATIQSAVDAVPDGATICIASGEYRETVTITDRSLTLLGFYGSDVTIVTAQDRGIPLSISGGASDGVVIQGLSLQRGQGFIGGGLAIDGATVELEDVSVWGCEAAGGGGVGIRGGAMVSATGLSIIDNDSSSEGGGLAVVEASTLLLADAVISGNYADSAFAAGGVYLADGSQLEWISGSLVGNGASGHGPWEVGGGGLGILDSAASLTDVEISDNATKAPGGGIGVGGTSQLDLLSVDIHGNESGYDTWIEGFGGGLWAGAAATLTFSDVSFTDNEALGGDGGGMWVGSEATLQATDLVLESNRAGGSGGGLRTESENATTIDGFIVSNNAADGGTGGGVMMSYGSATLSNLHITGNSARYAAGLCVSDGAVTINGALFADNHATSAGGALYIARGSSLLGQRMVVTQNSAGTTGAGMHVISSTGYGAKTVTLSLDHAVFLDNQATDEGGGLYMAAETDATLSLVLTHSILAGNSASSGGALFATGDVTFSAAYGDFYDNGTTPFDGPSDPTDSDGNLAVDPDWLDVSSSSWADWDLHLATTSPLIGAGDPTSTDPDGSTADMGAYGGPDAGSWDLDGDGYPLWWQPGAYDTHSYPSAGWDCDDMDEAVHPGAGC